MASPDSIMAKKASSPFHTVYREISLLDDARPFRQRDRLVRAVYIDRIGLSVEFTVIKIYQGTGSVRNKHIAAFICSGSSEELQQRHGIYRIRIRVVFDLISRDTYNQVVIFQDIFHGYYEVFLVLFSRRHIVRDMILIHVFKRVSGRYDRFLQGFLHEVLDVVSKDVQISVHCTWKLSISCFCFSVFA